MSVCAGRESTGNSPYRRFLVQTSAIECRPALLRDVPRNRQHVRIRAEYDHDVAGSLRFIEYQARNTDSGHLPPGSEPLVLVGHPLRI